MHPKDVARSEALLAAIHKLQERSLSNPASRRAMRGPRRDVGPMTWLLVAAGAALFACAEPPVDADQGEIRVAFKADDMGAAQGINEGTIRAYREGVVTSTDVIVPGPWFLDAARLLAEHPGLDVGIHLTLTSEWDRIKWRPLTAARSIVDRDGYFFPMVRPNRNFPPGSSLLEAKPDLKEVEAELRAQIEAASRHIPRVSFLSAHMGAATATPELKALTDRLSMEYKIPMQDGLRARWLGRVYEGADAGSVKAEKLAKRLESLEPGDYIHLDHAATLSPESRALGHEGYRNVAEDRAANVEAWCSPAVRQVIERRKIRRVSVRELLAK